MKKKHGLKWERSTWDTLHKNLSLNKLQLGNNCWVERGLMVTEKYFPPLQTSSVMFEVLENGNGTTPGFRKVALVNGRDSAAWRGSLAGVKGVAGEGNLGERRLPAVRSCPVPVYSEVSENNWAERRLLRNVGQGLERLGQWALFTGPTFHTHKYPQSNQYTELSYIRPAVS